MILSGSGCHVFYSGKFWKFKNGARSIALGSVKDFKDEYFCFEETSDAFTSRKKMQFPGRALEEVSLFSKKQTLVHVEIEIWSVDNISWHLCVKYRCSETGKWDNFSFRAETNVERNQRFCVVLSTTISWLQNVRDRFKLWFDSAGMDFFRRLFANYDFRGKMSEKGWFWFQETSAAYTIIHICLFSSVRTRHLVSVRDVRLPICSSS